MKCLSLISNNVRVDQQAQDEYCKLFERTLTSTPTHLSALAAIFGLTTDGEDQVHSANDFLSELASCCCLVLVVCGLFPINLSTILIWNAQGLNMAARRNSVCEVVLSSMLSSKADIVSSRN